MTDPTGEGRREVGNDPDVYIPRTEYRMLCERSDALAAAEARADAAERQVKDLLGRIAAHRQDGRWLYGVARTENDVRLWSVLTDTEPGGEPTP